MHTILTGVNFKTLPVAGREKMYFSGGKLNTALPQLLSYPAINECVILSTCNRVEIYAVTDNVEEAYDNITCFISDFHNIPSGDFLPAVYRKRCNNAVNHLFRVVSSLDSMIVGEYEILGQVKTAFETAQKLNTVKEFLNRLFQMAIVVGKRVRTETAIGKGAISTGSVTAGLISEIFPGNRKLEILIVGAGTVAELTATNLVSKIPCNLTITNRSKPNAVDFAGKFNAGVIDFEEKNKYYNNFDVLIFSTGSSEYVLTCEEAGCFNLSNGKKIALIDLSVPRNIDPGLGEIEGVYLNTIDNLEAVIDSCMDERSREIAKTEIIIKEQEEKFLEWYNMQSVMPAMRQIKQEFNALQSLLLRNYASQLSGLTDEQQEVVKNLMAGYSEVIIKTIMLNLKEVTDASTLHNLGDALRKSFKMHPQPGDAHNPHDFPHNAAAHGEKMKPAGHNGEKKGSCPFHHHG